MCMYSVLYIQCKITMRFPVSHRNGLDQSTHALRSYARLGPTRRRSGMDGYRVRFLKHVAVQVGVCWDKQTRSFIYVCTLYGVQIWGEGYR